MKTRQDPAGDRYEQHRQDRLFDFTKPLLREIRSELEADGRQFTFLCGHDSNIASVLAALGVEDYLLPNAVEQRTPIGVKLVFSRYVDRTGKADWSVELVYQTTEQLRGMTPLSLENPPMRFPLSFEGVQKNADGLIAESDLLALLDAKISACDALPEQFGDALEPAA